MKKQAIFDKELAYMTYFNNFVRLYNVHSDRRQTNAQHLYSVTRVLLPKNTFTVIVNSMPL